MKMLSKVFLKFLYIIGQCRKKQLKVVSVCSPSIKGILFAILFILEVLDLVSRTPVDAVPPVTGQNLETIYVCHATSVHRLCRTSTFLNRIFKNLEKFKLQNSRSFLGSTTFSEEF